MVIFLKNVAAFVFSIGCAVLFVLICVAFGIYAE